VFGISFTEIAVIALVALIVVGPHKLPGMLRTLGEWIGKLRRLTSEVRAQTGIDDILRQEGIEGGLGELRSVLRGDLGVSQRTSRTRLAADPYPDAMEIDRYREYPPEGADAYGALPDDLVDDAVDQRHLPATDASAPRATRTGQTPA
jgi:sec-independent protein translocase protein TatB